MVNGLRCGDEGLDLGWFASEQVSEQVSASQVDELAWFEASLQLSEIP